MITTNGADLTRHATLYTPDDIDHIRLEVARQFNAFLTPEGAAEYEHRVRKEALKRVAKESLKALIGGSGFYQLNLNGVARDFPAGTKCDPHDFYLVIGPQDDIEARLKNAVRLCYDDGLFFSSDLVQLALFKREAHFEEFRFSSPNPARCENVDWKLTRVAHWTMEGVPDWQVVQLETEFA